MAKTKGALDAAREHLDPDITTPAAGSDADLAAAGGDEDEDESQTVQDAVGAIDRLADIAAECPLDLETLTADLRDGMLEIFRHRPKPWDQMLESDRLAVAKLVQTAVNAVVTRAVELLAADDRPGLKARLEKFAGKGGKFQITLVALGEPEMAADLARMDGHEVLVISADAQPYQTARKPRIPPDQAPLEFNERAEDMIEGDGEEELVTVRDEDGELVEEPRVVDGDELPDAAEQVAEDA